MKALILLLVPSLAFGGIQSPTLARNVGICSAYLDDIGKNHTPLIDKHDYGLIDTYLSGYQFGIDQVEFALIPTTMLYNDFECHTILAKEKEQAREYDAKNSK